MSIETHVRSAGSPWMAQSGPQTDVAISSRVRLARNLKGFNFPDRLSEEGADRVAELLQERFQELGEAWEYYLLKDLNPTDLRVLVEKHLVSPQLAQTPRFAALGLTLREDEAVMVNEEDHIRIQAFAPGLATHDAWEKAHRTDDALEETVEWSFEPSRGYLTACPTNLGTGLRVSVMVHLPGMVLTQTVGHLLQALSNMGVAVRGLYGEGTQATGEIFQISNQVTLGQSEEQLVEGVQRVALQVVDREREARERLVKDRMEELQDRIFRAKGTLENARLLSAEEAIEKISTLRLGVGLGLLKAPSYETLGSLMVMSLPGYLERVSGRTLSKGERLSLRASLIRERLSKEEA